MVKLTTVFLLAVSPVLGVIFSCALSTNRVLQIPLAYAIIINCMWDIIDNHLELATPICTPICHFMNHMGVAPMTNSDKNDYPQAI